MLVFNRRLRFRQVLGCLVLAELLQLLWMVHGAFTPGFDAGTTWIASPDAHDLGWLFTSTFSIGHLTMHPDGFPSSSPWALVGLGGVGLMALALNLSGRRTVATGQAAHDRGQAPASTSSQESTDSPVSVDEPLHAQRCIAMFLGLLSVLFIAALFVGSRAVHLWTLRNMIVITPALTWGTTLGLLLLAGMPRNQQFVALALLTVSLAQLIGTGHALRSPYKSQLSQAIQRAAELRTQYPAMHVYQARSDYWWLYSSQLPPTNREYQRIMTPYTATILRRIGDITPAPAGVPTLYLMYTSPSLSSARVDQRILANNRPGCHAEAFTQVAFVFCTP